MAGLQSQVGWCLLTGMFRGGEHKWAVTDEHLGSRARPEARPLVIVRGKVPNRADVVPSCEQFDEGL